MRKKILVLMFVFLLMFLIGTYDINAVCYKLTSKSGDVTYTEKDPYDMGGFDGQLEIAPDSYCVKIEDPTSYDNFSSEEPVSCGDGMLTDIPRALPKVISIIYTLIQVAVPVVLVVFGILDLFKAMTAEKEDEIKKGQQMLIKRVISAVIIFFVFLIVRFIVSVAAGDKSKGILGCAECFITNECEVVGGQ